ncbi:hypothetical protein ACQKE4_15035, partial [Halomonas sp. NPDC076908]|uniref:hypothetical protein n=1 Tax=Halomonas sp. NPDC076908 TaxID=3390567 RepID=UPI003D04C4FE
LAKANLHGAKDQKVLAGGDRESVGAGFTDSGICYSQNYPLALNSSNKDIASVIRAPYYPLKNTPRGLRCFFGCSFSFFTTLGSWVLAAYRKPTLLVSTGVVS